MNANLPPSFSKVCSSCGLEKPLSAFLELSGDAAGTYGNICGTCRKEHIEKNKLKDKEDSSRTETGHKIDSKAKVASDIDKKQTVDRAEELYHEERDENEIIETGELEKKDQKQKGERKHRETFLDRRRTQTDIKKFDEKENIKTHLAIDEESREISNTQENAREERKKSEIDFTSPVVDTQISGKEIFTKGIAIRQFATWAGRGSAIGNRLGNKQPDNTNANKTKEGPTLSDEAERLWGPKKR
jgi:hypothetical protein